MPTNVMYRDLKLFLTKVKAVEQKMHGLQWFVGMFPKISFTFLLSVKRFGGSVMNRHTSFTQPVFVP